MSERAAYLRDGTAIYERSFAIIRAEADLSRFSAEEADVAVRMIHACGAVEAAQHIVFGRNLVAAARGALAAGAPILCDAEMVAHGITRARLPAQQRGDLHAARSARAGARREARHHALGGGARFVARPARRRAWSPSAMRRPRCSACSSCIDAGAPKPAAILGIPVGFVGAAEVEGGARRRSARRAVPHRARAHGRQRHDRRRGQRAGEGRAMSAANQRQALGRRRRAGRSGTDDAEGDARARRGRRDRAFRQGRKRQPCARHRGAASARRRRPSCRCSIR